MKSFKIAGAGLAILAIGISILFAASAREQRTQPRIIEVGPFGFKPASLVIREGEIVVFRSVGGPAWPAGDFHPEHALYPEFDPKAPVKDGEGWSFRFDNPGEWTFHDHLSPSRRGIIRVLGSDTGIDCDSGNGANPSICWDREISRILDKEGLPAAFAYFAKLYTTEPSFVAEGCHWQAHKLGEKAAEEFNSRKPVRLTPATAYCGFGFFHGFLQVLLREDGSILRAKEFCEEVTREVGSEAPRARLNCYHGIGHGFVEDPPPPDTWNDTEAVIKEPLRMCLGISEVPLEVKECTDGVYNALLILMESGKYGFKLSEEDPLGFCREEPEKYHRSCFYEFSQKLDRYAEWKIENLSRLLRGVPASFTEMIAMNSVAGIIQRDVSLSDFMEHAKACRSIPGEGGVGCLKGIVGGLMAHGEPEKEYLKALDFCGGKNITSAERKICYTHLLETASQMYPGEKLAGLCASFPDDFQELCRD